MGVPRPPSNLEWGNITKIRISAEIRMMTLSQGANACSLAERRLRVWKRLTVRVREVWHFGQRDGMCFGQGLMRTFFSSVSLNLTG